MKKFFIIIINILLISLCSCEKDKESVAELSFLTIKNDSNQTINTEPAFSSNIYEYKMNVGAQTKNIAVSLKTQSDFVKRISVNGNTNLVKGENKITIEIVSEDGSSTKKYVISAYKYNDDVKVTSTLYNVNQSSSVITIPFWELSLKDALKNILPPQDGSYKIYKADGTTLATDTNSYVDENFKVISTAEDKIHKGTYSFKFTCTDTMNIDLYKYNLLFSGKVLSTIGEMSVGKSADTLKKYKGKIARINLWKDSSYFNTVKNFIVNKGVYSRRVIIGHCVELTSKTNKISGDTVYMDYKSTLENLRTLVKTYSDKAYYKVFDATNTEISNNTQALKNTDYIMVYSGKFSKKFTLDIATNLWMKSDKYSSIFQYNDSSFIAINGNQFSTNLKIQLIDYKGNIMKEVETNESQVSNEALYDFKNNILVRYQINASNVSFVKHNINDFSKINTYTYNNSEGISKMIRTNDDNGYMISGGRSSGLGLILCKLNDNFTEVWKKNYYGNGAFEDIIADNNSYVAVGRINADAYICKIDETGAIIWSDTLQGNSDKFIKVTKFNNAYYAITSKQILKYSTSGQLESTTPIAFTDSSDKAISMFSNENYLIIGTKQAEALKYNTNIDVINYKNNNELYYDEIIKTKDGYIIRNYRDIFYADEFFNRLIAGNNG